MKILINNQEQENIKAIKVDDYFVIVDLTAPLGNIIHEDISGIFSPYETGDFVENPKCIIASTKRIDSAIPLIVFKEQTVEELVEKEIISMGGINRQNTLLNYFRGGFIKGYNQAKSSDKNYTEEDMEAAVCFGKTLERFKDDEFKDSDDEEWSGFLHDLNQLKLPDVINLRTEWDISHTERTLDYKLITTSTPEGEIIEITI